MSDNTNEQHLMRDILGAAVIEQRRARRWRIFFRFVYLTVIVAILLAIFSPSHSVATKEPHAALIKIEGMIAADKPANAQVIRSAIRHAFKNKQAKAIILKINSPGGTPVQAGQIFDEIMQQRKAHPKKPVYAVIDDIGASGAYFIAAAANKIYANRMSMVGSIGVLFNGFGVNEAMKKWGIERRLVTAGKQKGMLDPFSPEKPEDKKILESMLKEVHQSFIQSVKEGRGDRLKPPLDKLWSGRIWTGQTAKKLGLIDDFGDIDFVKRKVIKVKKVLNYTPKELPERLGKLLGASAPKNMIQHVLGDRLNYSLDGSILRF